MRKLCVALSLSGLRILGFFSGPLLSDDAIHRVVGEPTRFERRPDDDGRVAADLNVITWNIERGAQYNAILEALRQVNADVILLQEVDRYCKRSGGRDVARDLADALQMNWVMAGEFQEIGEADHDRPAITGQAILSRFSIEQTAALRFRAQNWWRWSFNPVQPRRGGRIALRARTAGTTVYNTHLESGSSRTLQQRQIAEILVDAGRQAQSGPTVIGGDFNNGPLRHASMFSSLNAASFSDALTDVSSRGPTSRGEPTPIDWIFVKDLSPVTGSVLRSVKASDHFPVVASFAPGLSGRPSR